MQIPWLIKDLRIKKKTAGHFLRGMLLKNKKKNFASLFNKPNKEKNFLYKPFLM